MTVARKAKPIITQRRRESGSETEATACPEAGAYPILALTQRLRFVPAFVGVVISTSLAFAKLLFHSKVQSFFDMSPG
jgi:hypothetical protein